MVERNPVSRRAIMAGVAGGLAISALPRVARADARQDAADLVSNATTAVSSMRRDENLSAMDRYLKDASGAMIFPQLVRGGFIVGGEGGSGVLLVKGSDGTWSPPAFYTLAAGSIGFQIGGQVAEVVFAIMNQGAVEAVLKNSFKFGADASIAVGPVGQGVAASTTTNLQADIISFSRTQGLFGGGSLEGTALLPKDSYNAAYYGAQGVTPRQIVIERRYFNAGADALRKALP